MLGVGVGVGVGGMVWGGALVEVQAGHLMEGMDRVVMGIKGAGGSMGRHCRENLPEMANS